MLNADFVSTSYQTHSTSWLQEPSYGYAHQNRPYRPTPLQVLAETIRNINIFQSLQNWSGFTYFLFALWGLWALAVYFSYMFSAWQFVFNLLFMFAYMGPMLEAVLHRGINHHAFQCRNPVVDFLARNILIVKDILDEHHQIPHLVHHQKSDQIGDPYNAKSGWLPLWLMEYNHLRLSPSLSENQFNKALALGKRYIWLRNSYRGFQRWGTLTHPVQYLLEVFVSLAFWITANYFLGGWVQVYSFFAAYWLYGFVVVRNVNFFGHWGGKTCNHKFLVWGVGQYHHNHHQFPNLATTALQESQWDRSYFWIRLLEVMGLVKNVRRMPCNH